ncbi:MAG: NAD+ synthase [Bacteroidia bacterium]|nr:NAD+ synthase [Bacteroidia bacterium]
MRIALAQLNYHIGNFAGNTDKILHAISEAKKNDADIIVFGELSICGYPPLDFLEYDDFLSQCMEAVQVIAKHCVGIAAIVGSPAKNPVLAGKNLYNAAFFLAEGEIKSITNKALLPTYDVFDEYRYFEPAKEFSCIEYQNQKIAVTICEDLWNLDDDPLYTHCPMDALILEKPAFIINIAASPFSYQHAEVRKQTLIKNAGRYKLPIVYVHQVGAQTDIVFDGGSMVLNHQGSIVQELAYFKEEIRYVDLKINNAEVTDITSQTTLVAKASHAEKYSLIYDALLLGITDYFTKLGFKKSILGLSGGIDSAVVYALAVKALGVDNVLPVMMPSAFSSSHSVNDSEKMIANLGGKGQLIAIEKIYKAFETELQPIFNGLPFNVAEENLQSRIRGMLVMALSNKFGHVLLNTSNKSELAVGYGTLYGDMCGGLSVIGDLYKTDVYGLANFINRNQEIIPQNIIDKAPSAELRPNQKDSDSLPPYDVLDAILYLHIEARKSFAQIVGAGFETTLVKRILSMVSRNEFKRVQFAPIIRVSAHAFGLGRRMPVVAKYNL